MLGDAVDAEFRSSTLISDPEELAAERGQVRPDLAARQNKMPPKLRTLGLVNHDGISTCAIVHH
jgi:hypothetical protein